MEFTVLNIVIYAAFCLCLGSAMTAYVVRTPKYEEYTWRKEAHQFLDIPFNESSPLGFHSGRSQCPNCHNKLKAYDLIPIFSYLITKGQCRYCHTKISIKYPLTELACLVSCLPLLMINLPLAPLMITTVIITTLIGISIIDWQHQWIPDHASLLILGLGLTLNLLLSEVALYQSVLGMLIGYLLIVSIRQIYLTLRKIEAIGLGDAKLLAALGAWQGLENLFYILFFASILGVLYAILNKQGRHQSMAFGPFLCASAFMTYFKTYLIY